MKKILIVGAGGIGKKHIDGFLRTGEFSISICDVDIQKINKIKEEYPLDNTFNDFYSTPLKSFDAVLIATPANYHIPMAIRCAGEGIPFLVEKPLSVSMEGVDGLIRIIEKNKVPSAVGFTRRSIPSFIKLKEIIDSGITGEIKMSLFFVAQDYRKYRPDYGCIYFARQEMGGGCILDAVSHMIDLAQWYIGSPSEGFCIYDNLAFGKEIETEDSAVITGRFNKKSMVNFYCNLFQKPYELLIEFAGMKGNLRYISENRYVSRILFSDNDEGRWSEMGVFENEIKDYYFYQAKNFINLLAGKDNTLTTIEEAAENLKFLLEVKR